MLVKGAPGIHAIPLSKGNNYHQHLPYVRLLLITECPGHANKVVRHLCSIPARSARAAVAQQSSPRELLMHRMKDDAANQHWALASRNSVLAGRMRPDSARE